MTGITGCCGLEETGCAFVDEGGVPGILTVYRPGPGLALAIELGFGDV